MFEVQVYGVPPSHPGDYDLAEAAIDRAKRELLSKQYPANARVIDKRTKNPIWSGYLTADGQNVETK